MGKTALALNMAQNAAMATKQPVAIFSLEMSKEQLVNRMISSLAEIDQQTLRNGRIYGDDWIRLVNAVAPFRGGACLHRRHPCHLCAGSARQSPSFKNRTGFRLNHHRLSAING